LLEIEIQRIRKELLEAEIKLSNQELKTEKVIGKLSNPVKRIKKQAQKDLIN